MITPGETRHPAPPPLPLQPPPLMPPASVAGWHPPVPYHPTADDRSMGMLCHLLAILTGFLGPLILWLVRKRTRPLS